VPSASGYVFDRGSSRLAEYRCAGFSLVFFSGRRCEDAGSTPVRVTDFVLGTDGQHRVAIVRPLAMFPVTCWALLPFTPHVAFEMSGEFPHVSCLVRAGQ